MGGLVCKMVVLVILGMILIVLLNFIKIGFD